MSEAIPEDARERLLNEAREAEKRSSQYERDGMLWSSLIFHREAERLRRIAAAMPAPSASSPSPAEPQPLS